MRPPTPPYFRHRVLAAGYFPKELPPPFTTRPFADFAKANLNYIDDPFDAKSIRLRSKDKGYVSKLVKHNLARPGTNRRVLGIPNPINQLRVVQAIEPEWRNIVVACNKSPYISSIPQFKVAGGRAINPKWTGKSFEAHRAKVRSGARYVVRADVTSFYPSIYTHSVPWALHGKSAAKTHRGASLAGNVIDKAIREGQDGQTIGLPIGPDTSFAIAELLLSAVDVAASNPNKGRGWRWYDDYEVGFYDQADADAFCDRLEHELAGYELEINGYKTRVEPLPLPLTEKWHQQLQDVDLRDRLGNQPTNLTRLFSLAFEHAPRSPKDGVLRYAVMKMYGMVTRGGRSAPVVHPFHWDLAEHLVHQVAVIEPNSLPAVLGLLAFHDAYGYGLDTALLAETLGRVAVSQSRRALGSDVAWALWGYVENDLSIPDDVADAAAALDCDVCGLVLLHAKSLRLVSASADLSPIDARVAASDFESANWLLAYESWHKGWLSGSITKKISESKHAQALHDADVYFYRVGPHLRKYESALHPSVGAPAWRIAAIPYAPAIARTPAPALPETPTVVDEWDPFQNEDSDNDGADTKSDAGGTPT